MIQHRCPHCEGLLENSDGVAGMSIDCRHCGTSLVVPNEGIATVESPMHVAEMPPDLLVDRIGRLIGAHVADTPPHSITIPQRILLILFSPLISLLMGGGFIFLIYSLVECQVSKSWPTVQGTVERVGTMQKHERSARGRPMTTTSTSVVYEYTVDGKTHTSARLTFGDRDNYAFLARALAAKYQPGQQVTVYYDPANPEYAVLLRDVQASTYVLGVAGVFMGCIGLRMFLVAAIPINALSNSRWAPWSYRVTWPDLIIVPSAVVALLLYVPSLIGL